jgi:N-methylhydantoinase A
MPGLTSALGCLLGQLRHDFSRTMNMVLSALDVPKLTAVCEEIAVEGRRLLLQEGAVESDMDIKYGADMCYRGQTHVIQVEFDGPQSLDAKAVRAAFEKSYRARYGLLLEGQEIRLVNVRVTLSNLAKPPELGALIQVPRGEPPAPDHAPVYFDGKSMQAAVYERHALPVNFEIAGPAILLQSDSTTFIEPGYAGRVHASGNVIIEATS